MADTRDVLDAAIPAVHLHKIVLETSSMPLAESNPHVDDEREDLSLKSTKSGKAQVTLEISIDEKFDDSDLGAWLDNEDFTRFLSIRIFQCRSQRMYRDLVRGKMTLEEAIKRNRKKDRVRILSVKDDILSKDLNQNYQSVDSDGDGMYEIMYHVKFVIPTAEPKNLSYHMETFLDVEAIEKEYRIDLSGLSFDGITSPSVHEQVVRNYIVRDTRFDYLLPSGEAWDGPKHQMEDGRWMSGREHGGSSEYLERTEVPNSIINDYRDTKDRLQLDLTALDKELSLIKRKVKIANADFELPRSSNYFSEICLSRDNREHCRYLFSVDYGKLVREGTKYGKYFGDDHKRLMNAVKLRSLKLVRKRVKKIKVLNDVGSPVLTGNTFDKESPAETVAVSGEVGPGEFAKSKTKAGSIEETFLGSVGRNGVRHFTGTDRLIDDLTGDYMYGVEVEIEDNTVYSLLRIYQRLIREQARLERYYNEAVKPQNYDPVTNRLTTSFIQKMKRKTQRARSRGRVNRLPWISPIRAYLNVLDLLYDTKRSLGVEESQNKLAASLWSFISPSTGNPRGISTFMGMFSEATVKLGETIGATATMSEGTSNLNHIGAKSKASSKKVALRTFKAEKYFNNTFNASTPRNTGYDYLPVRKKMLREMMKSDGLVTMTGGQFGQRVDFETLKYFKSLGENVNIVSQEVVVTKGDTMDNMKLAYLSPSYVKLYDTPWRTLLRRGTRSRASRLLQEIQLNIQGYNSSMAVTKTMPKVHPPVRWGFGRRSRNSVGNMVNLLAHQNCTIEPVLDYYENEEEQREMSDSAEAFGKGTDDAVRVEEDPTPINRAYEEYKIRRAAAALMYDLVLPDVAGGYSVGASIKTPEQARGDFSAIIDLDHPENGIGKLFEENEDVNSQSIKRLPNQIKSIFAKSGAKRKPRGGLGALDNEPLFNFYYRMIRKVEVLVGYELSSDGQVLLQSPDWQMMTREIYDEAARSGASLLCRLVKYTNPNFGIFEVPGLELPVYDDYFILRASPLPLVNTIHSSKSREEILDDSATEKLNSLEDRQTTKPRRKSTSRRLKLKYRPPGSSRGRRRGRRRTRRGARRGMRGRGY